MPFERIWHRSYPSFTPAEIDFETITLPEMLTRTAERFPDQTALLYLGKKISYRHLEALVNRFARALLDIGVKKGDRVGMLLPNIPQLIIANYAVYRIGAITAMNNPLYTKSELLQQFNDSGCSVLITLDRLAPMGLKLQKNTHLHTIISCHINDYLPFPKKQLFPLLKKDMYRKTERGESLLEFTELIGRFPEEPLPSAAGWEDVAALLYTGGTTGVSKGAMLTHANLSCNVQQIRCGLPFEDGRESELAVFPFFHSAGFTGVQNLCIYAGWTDVLVPRPEPEMIVQILKKYKPTIMPGVPTIYIGLLASETFQKMDLSFIKAFMAGAAPLSTDTIRQLKDLTGAGIINVYGLTEISPMGTATPWGGKEKPGSVGTPIPGTDLKIVDLDSGETEMPPGEPGEVVFKGPQVMKGYYNRPEETAKVLKNGWLHTGDIGVLDEDGYLTIVDRKKDMIVASGYNIYPNEIDNVLLQHPKILEACVVGVPDAYRGETTKAFIVPATDQSLSEQEVKAFCREKLAAYKVPKQIELVEELPKSAVGKILRRKLRDKEKV